MVPNIIKGKEPFMHCHKTDLKIVVAKYQSHE